MPKEILNHKSYSQFTYIQADKTNIKTNIKDMTHPLIPTKKTHNQHNTMCQNNNNTNNKNHIDDK